MIVYHDGEPWFEATVEDPRGRPTDKTLAMPLNVYLLAASESKSLADLRLKLFELGGEFARMYAAMVRRPKTMAAVGGAR